ncbi:hypothetical protein K502DRAFT_365454 [Neoconidiobolus thromboides FSU 785]|nr:hypothetical protein K502DRAFT_365454 [Neoconidiobolus thromboides FSU 785]
MLVNYSDSDNEEAVNKVEKEKLPLPEFIIKDNEKKKRSFDPTFHQGRIRKIPHIEGNWSFFLFLKIPVDIKYSQWYSKLTKETNNVFSKEYGNKEGLNMCINKEINSFTLSLSKTCFFKYEQLRGLESKLKYSFREMNKFTIQFNNLTYFENEDKTRTFLSLETSSNSNQKLNILSKKMNIILLTYNQPPFYDPPRFHTSLYWSLPPFSINETILQSLLNNEKLTQQTSTIEFEIDKLYYKLGHRIESINLQ